MKYRTFFATLALFLITFHLGICALSVLTFQDTANRAKQKSLGEHQLLTSMLLKDIRALEHRGQIVEGAMPSLLQSYLLFFDENRVSLALYLGAELVYSNGLVYSDGWEGERHHDMANTNDETRRVTSRRDSDGRTYVTVSGRLPAPYQMYTIVYLYDATDSFAAWSRTKNAMYWIGGIISVLLALGLMYLLHRLFKPLSQISETSRQIAAGAYDTRLPVKGKDELAEMAQSFNDMAEEIQRQMAELQMAADKKQQFIDNFAHELRTPLTAIYGYAEFLQKAALTEDERLSAIDYIMSESRRLQSLANQLLELANYRNRQADWKPQKVPELFRHVERSLLGKLREKEIQLEWIHEIDTIHGDGALLQSLLINLLDNAINACSERGRIIVRARMESGKPTISVQDNGRGMSAEVLQNATEPFYRADPSRRRKDGGTGLGLAICKQIAEHHDALLEFRSVTGEGTVAKVIFTTS